MHCHVNIFFLVNLAVSLKQELGNKGVGLLDMDIFGPSLPIMMNLCDHKPQLDKGKHNWISYLNAKFYKK